MSRKPASFRREDVNRPPADQPWCWISAELLNSPAWRARSINCIRLIEFLMREHMQHAGMENGNLAAPYDQLQAFGIGRRLIRPAIEEAEALRLIEVRRGGKRNAVEDHVSRYRLTFYATRIKPPDGKPYWQAATDEWKAVTAPMAAEIAPQIQARRTASKNRVQVHEGEPPQCT